MIIAGILSGISSLIDGLVGWIETAAVWVINLVITGIATDVNLVVSLLPSMPAQPTIPQPINVGLDWVGYWFPMSYLFNLIVTMGAIWLTWIVIRIPLRWGKANPE